MGDHIRNGRENKETKSEIEGKGMKRTFFPPFDGLGFSRFGGLENLLFLFPFFLLLLVKTFWMMLPPFKNDAICLTLKS